MSHFVSRALFAQEYPFWPAARRKAVPRRAQAHQARFQGLWTQMAGALTPEERLAVARWSHGPLCDQWNAELRSGQVSSPELHLIASAFGKMRAPRQLTTYSGLSAPHPQQRPWPLEQAGCTSTSLSTVTALSFADPSAQFGYGGIDWRPEHATQLAVVRIPKGHPILLVRGQFTELEVLLPPNLSVHRVWFEPGPEPDDRRSVARYDLRIPTGPFFSTGGPEQGTVKP